MRIFLALVHFPVVDRQGKVLATAITNVDLHDLGRSGRTYGAESVFVVTPIVLQQRMVQEVYDHWTKGAGSSHVRRAAAVSLVEPVASLQDAAQAIATRTGRAPTIAVTGAQMAEPNIDFATLRAQILADDGQDLQPPLLLVFGTGWGLAAEAIALADLRLPPIHRHGNLKAFAPGYNHLSVRAAAAIALDRLCGDGNAT